MTDSNPVSVESVSENSGSGPVGMCLSGGGYRAAAFHLGALHYMDRIGILQRLSALSTVSGGTFTGTKYILSLVEGQPFREFFQRFYRDLADTHLVKDGLDHLAAQRSNVESGRQDLIVSMAAVYAEKFFSKPGEANEAYYFDAVLSGVQPVGDVTLNATDFRSGIAFRFQRSKDERARIGNFYNSIAKEDAAAIRLADIVAASSCFPGGFEPIAFPYDFSWRGGKIPAAVRRSFPPSNSGADTPNPQGPVALMDGGVFDNQGLDSLLMAEGRSKESFDLVVISDVDQPSLALYEMPGVGDYGGMRLSTIQMLARLFAVACVVTIVAIGWNVWGDVHGGGLTVWRLVFVYLIPAVLSVATVFVLWKIKGIIDRDVIQPLREIVGGRSWGSVRSALGRITVGQLRNMLKLRVSSLLTLTSSVFMKRIRQLVYGLAYRYGSGEDKEASNGRRLANVIYTLAPAKTKVPPLPGVTAPSKELSGVARAAFSFETTLWFDEAWQEPSLVASGQASFCYNMFKLLERRHGKQPEEFPSEARAEYAQLLRDWEQFNKDPFFILKDEVEGDWKEILRGALAAPGSWGMFERAGDGA